MDIGQLFRLILFLGLIASSISIPLSENDKEKLKKLQPIWKSPPIDKFLDGEVTTKGNLCTYVFRYVNNESNKTCNVTYKEKLNQATGKVTSRHEWKCVNDVPAAPEDVGADYTR